MTPKTLKKDIQISIHRLLEMVKDLCTNTISENLVYLVSEIKDTELNANEELKKRIRENNVKEPISFENAIDILLAEFENLYDINIYIHKAEKNRTIVDIRFYTKLSFERHHRRAVKFRGPMLHCKISNPMYYQEGKFDLNWEHGGIKHKWKLFWYRKKLKKEIKIIKNRVK